MISIIICAKGTQSCNAINYGWGQEPQEPRKRKECCFKMCDLRRPVRSLATIDNGTTAIPTHTHWLSYIGYPA